MYTAGLNGDRLIEGKQYTSSEWSDNSTKDDFIGRKLSSPSSVTPGVLEGKIVSMDFSEGPTEFLFEKSDTNRIILHGGDSAWKAFMFDGAAVVALDKDESGVVFLLSFYDCGHGYAGGVKDGQLTESEFTVYFRDEVFSCTPDLDSPTYPFT